MNDRLGHVAARAITWNSYWIAVLFGAYTLVIVGFDVGVLTDTPSPQRRAAVLMLVTYWTTIGIFGGSTVLIVVSRILQWRYLASFAASIPPMYELWIYTVYPLANPPLGVNWIGSVLWAWLLPILVLLVHWEHEQLAWVDHGTWTPRHGHHEAHGRPETGLGPKTKAAR